MGRLSEYSEEDQERLRRFESEEQNSYRRTINDYAPININHLCTVNLTVEGVKALEGYYRAIGYEGQASSVWRGTLWELSVIFGQHFHMGMKTPLFFKNEILIDPIKRRYEVDASTF